MNSVIYITRNGLLEPLGQSQVMAYLKGLSKDNSITLITYEKSEDWFNKDAMAKAKAECESYNIKWLPQRFRSRLKFISHALSIIRMVWLVRREVLISGIRLIHARSYIPAAVALIVSRFTKVPFIFDMRALWPEELIAAGRLRRGSIIHRIIVVMERLCLAESSGIVSLTNAAVSHLKLKYPAELTNKSIVVIPTCADLKRFTPKQNKNIGTTVHGCIGTIMSGWFRTDLLASWMHAVAESDLDSNFEIITRDNPSDVRKALDSSNTLSDRLKITSRSTEAMPDALRLHDLSIMFFTSGLSKLGSAPTRLAEALGCGIPVVANGGVGDLEEIIRQNNVGVVIEGESNEEMRNAFKTLQLLRNDPELSKRCRSTAETIFSLKNGTKAYNEMYVEIFKLKNSSCVD